MSLNGIANSALTALRTNTAALSVVSNNVANINTPGYARRVVNEQTLAAGGQLMGVDIASVQRVVDKFLQGEVLSAGASAAQYDAQSNFYSQFNSVLGGPGGDQSLSTGLTNLQAALATASQAPSASASAIGVLTSLNGLAGDVSNVSGTIGSLQTQIDNQVVSSVADTNALIKQIYEVNTQIKTAYAAGDTSTPLMDQRDQMLNTLSQQMGIKVTDTGDGGVAVATTDGVNLVSTTYAQLSYAGGAQNGVYGTIQVADVNPQTGQAIGMAGSLEPHLNGGSLRGLLDMRDTELGGLAQSLGGVARSIANAFNAQANANAAYPPPSSLTGRQTGLLSTDALNFSGKTTIAVADANGGLVSRIDVDFGAGTLSADGGLPISLGTTIGSFAAALNTALGANGSASFTNGQLALSANGGDGLVVQDDDSTPSSRGDTPFSQFFGLNDLFQAQVPGIAATGLSASDTLGTAGGAIALSLKSANGDVIRQASVTVPAGMTVGGLVTALNTAMGGAVNFALNSDGSITSTNSGAYSDYQLNVTADSTQRGSTGVSVSNLFGIGANTLASQAAGFAVTAAVQASPQRIGLATPGITSTSVPGDVIVGGGDNSGAIKLENVLTASRNFSAAGSLASQTGALSDYVASFYQDIATRSNVVTQNQTTQDDRLQEAQQRMASNSGVNLDEELTNLTTYQQAYAASARLLTVVGQLYDTLLQIQ